MTKSHRPSRAVFYFIAVCIPVAVILLFEGILRLTGFGHDYPLFVPAHNQPGYLTPNPNLIQRYFQQGAAFPNVSPDTYYFAAEKQPGHMRIVVMGGSTAAGFPYGRFGSPAGMLQQRLQQDYPDKEFDVISVAMASINSYTLRDISDEVLAISPDAVLIYAGHNEYLGVMGVGSSYGGNSHLANILFLTFKHWRLFQLLETVINKTSQSTEPQQAGRTVMASVARDKNIPLNSQTYQTGVMQLRSNMRAVLNTFSQAGVPVLLSSLASNELDQPPFASTDTPSIPSLTAFLNNRMATSAKLMQAQEAVKHSADSANAAFALGTVQAQLQEADAVHSLQRARDLDLLRFRAPSEFNAVLQSLSEASDTTYWVEGEAHIRSDEPTGIIGHKHMLEHLHPTARGYFLLADAFYRALRQHRIIGAPTLNHDTDYAWQHMPLTQVDLTAADWKIKRLTSDYPFTSSPVALTLPTPGNAEEALALKRFEDEPWLVQQPELLRLYQQQGRWQEAANVAGLLYTALPFNGQTAHIASQLYLRAGEPGSAWYFARQAVKLDPSDANRQLTLAECLYKLGRIGQARDILSALLKAQPDNKKARQYLNLLGGGS